jgi:ribosomal protein S5
LAGIINVTSKILGTTTNKLNNARAAIEALKKLSAKGGPAFGEKTSK